MLFRKMRKCQQNKKRTSRSLKSAKFSMFDLRGVARVYSHDSLLRFWSNDSGKRIKCTCYRQSRAFTITPTVACYGVIKGYKKLKPLSGLLLYRLMMPLAEILIIIIITIIIVIVSITKFSIVIGSPRV